MQKKKIENYINTDTEEVSKHTRQEYFIKISNLYNNIPMCYCIVTEEIRKTTIEHKNQSRKEETGNMTPNQRTYSHRFSPGGGNPYSPSSPSFTPTNNNLYPNSPSGPTSPGVSPSSPIYSPMKNTQKRKNNNRRPCNGTYNKVSGSDLIGRIGTLKNSYSITKGNMDLEEHGMVDEKVLISRDELLHVNDSMCFYCKDSPSQCKDHLIPSMNSKENTMGSQQNINRFPCCNKCNNKKSNKTPKEWLRFLEKNYSYHWTPEHIKVFENWIDDNQTYLYQDWDNITEDNLNFFTILMTNCYNIVKSGGRFEDYIKFSY